MSLLLDALRKSEAQRRAGEPPRLDLGSSDAPSAGRSRGRSGEWLGWALVVLVVVGGGAGLAWWQPWTLLQSTPLQASRPAGANSATSAVVAQAASNPDLASPASSERVTEGTAGRGAEPVPADPDPAPLVERSETGQANVIATPGPSAEAAARFAVVEEPVGGTPVPEDPAAEIPAADPPVQDGRPVEDPPASDVETGAATAAAVDPADRSAAIEAPPAPAATAKAPERDASLDGVIRPWELPQELRAEFPELRLTVHFYAARPADRFVLIDGERRGEGDSLGGGARIAEIRKRGLIVDFERYRILIE